MLLNLTITKLILYILISFVFGYYVIYVTVVYGDHQKTSFDTYYFFKKIKLVNIFEFVWDLLNKLIKKLLGFTLE